MTITTSIHGPYVETQDGTRLHVNDWGEGRPVVLVHGWPLDADSWETQALALAEAGLRVVAYDRRGFGRSSQPWGGYDYDTMADDLAAVLEAKDLADATLVGFSMGGGELARFATRHGLDRVMSLVFVSSIAPYLLKTDDNPHGVPSDGLDGIKEGLRADRPQFLDGFFEDFYGQGTEGGGVSDAVLEWTRHMALLASPRATLECVDAFGRTDLREDVKQIDVPTLVIHGTADQTVPIDATGRRMPELCRKARLVEYEGAPHGLPATHPQRLARDLVDFCKGR